MKSLLLTNEYPPHIYGGAGVHVEYLSRELAKIINVEVRCFGDQNTARGALRVKGFPLDQNALECPKPLKSVFGALKRCVDFNAVGIEADVVHCHTWYTHLGGILAKLNYGIPLVITVHSLEPLRPWKREQLGGGYDFSLWVEKTALEMADAVICVSSETREDVRKYFNVPEERMHVIHNGIDLDEYRRVDSQKVLKRFGIDSNRPYALFVGRITRQKGIIHLVNAVKYMNPDFQIVLCAGAPDTAEIATEMRNAVAAAQRAREGVIWIDEFLDVPAKVELYSHADVFVCPSIYEPFGIINLEAMACGVPVVAAAVGGIKEVVVHGETGLLVMLEQMQESPFEPLNPDQYARDLARAVNELMGNSLLRQKMGEAGRKRAEEHFSWGTIARRTVELYEMICEENKR